jgi:ketosteroid isomerase-like protein
VTPPAGDGQPAGDPGTVRARDAADELAVRRVLAACCHRLDDGDFEGLGALYAEDGTFDYAGQGATGRDAVAQWFAERNPPERRGKHLTVNVVVDVDGDRAHATSDYLFVRMEDGGVRAALTGRYEDDLVRADVRWLLARRVVVPFTTASPGGAP